jgi:hypothetical protein
VAAPAPAPAPPSADIASSSVEKKDEPGSVPDGAGPAVSAPAAPAPVEVKQAIPKPVEVQSVPDTPINNGTPAGGTPRPELKIDEDPKPAAPVADASAANPILGTQEPSKAAAEGAAPKENPAPESITDSAATAATAATTNGHPKPAEDANGGSAPKPATVAEIVPEAAAVGEKRKLEDESKESNGTTDSAATANQPQEHPEKKTKLTDKIVDKVSQVASKIESKTTTNGSAKGKPGRPKKEKKAPVVGRTERKTRSQGPI